jgi:predicted peptidase
MKKRLLITLFVLSALGTSGLISACSGSNSENNGKEENTQKEEKNINVELSENYLSVGEKAKISTDVQDANFVLSKDKVIKIENGEITGLAEGEVELTIQKEGYKSYTTTIHVYKAKTVEYIVEGFEYGPAITGVKLNLEGAVLASALEDAQFDVKTNGKVREVIKTSLCDENGEYINSKSGRFVRIDLKTEYIGNSFGGGDYKGSDCFSYVNNKNIWKSNVTASVSVGGELDINGVTYGGSEKYEVSSVAGRIVLSTKNWGEAKSHSAEGYTLTYKAFETKELADDGVKNPLVIWLHGAGEGGTDPDIALLGNDVTNLGEEKVQNHFKKNGQAGAYVLAVQTPTYWMDSGDGGINGGTGHSIYTKTLKSTIDKYISDNGDIETSKVFIGGCSNGGFMTMEMAITYGNFFKGFYPVCEAYADSFVSDDDIQKIKDLSIWFTHAANDTTVNPNNFTIPTYQRLMRAGAKDVHFSYFVDVRGKEGNEKGNSYMGHFSWIYTLKDECEFDQADYEKVSAPSTKPVEVNGTHVNLREWFSLK